MGSPSYFRTPQIVRIPSLLKQVRSGEIRVARFQRPFVWRDQQRLDLFDSIYKGMPIGSLLTWRTEDHELNCYEKIGSFPVNTEEGSAVNQYLLDGYQRLTTLYAALGAGVGEEYSKTDVEDPDVRWPIYFDLREQTFELKPRSSETPAHWLDLSIILNTGRLLDYQRKLEGEPDGNELVERAEELVELIKDYQIPMVPMVTEDLEQVTTSFQRINSEGTKMSEVHMVNALSYDAESEFELNERLEELQQQMGSFGWEEFEERLILHVLKAILGLDVYRSKAADISEEISGDPEILDTVLALIERTAQFMADQLNVYGPQTVPYSPQPVLIADALHANDGKINESAKREVKRWFWATTYSEHFASANSSKIRRAQEHLRRVVRGETTDLPSDLSNQVLPIERFDYRWARGRAIVLELAALDPRNSDGEPIDGFRQLADHGNNAATMLFSSRDIGKENNKGPENRFIVAPEDTKDFKSYLLDDLHNPPSDEWLASHAIPPNAMEALTETERPERERWREFLKARRNHILQMEKKRVEEVGLDYITETE
jgi:hypothetical protein